MRGLAFAFVAIGCRATPSVVVDAAIPDIAPLPTQTTIIVIESAAHHLGDDNGGTPAVAEGCSWQATFELAEPCLSASLEIDILPPWGPTYSLMPNISLNGNTLASPHSFFAWCSSAPFDCDMFPGDQPQPVALDATAHVQVGTNLVRVRVGLCGDDMFFNNVELHCGR